MIRLTGGEWKGRNIRTPEGRDTRPTPVMVRQALFNILGPGTRDWPFYDMFAGSGAVGFEALSHGAAHTTFVESGKGAQECLRHNADLLGCSDRIEIVRSPLPDWIATAGFAPEPPVALFHAAPYYKRLGHAVMEALAKRDIDWGDSLCVAQVENGEKLEAEYGPWRLEKVYRYGLTELWLYSCPLEDESVEAEP
jgi:16S rRNA (guanine966-N2)-methyltransferase